MNTFTSLLAFAEHLVKVAEREVVFIDTGLEECAKLIEKSAKKEIGHLQPEVGPFPAWAELAESTIDDKARHGYLYSADGNPLLRTGALEESISHKVNPLEAIIGSTSPIMVYHEFGTIKMPMRPVIGPAAYKNKDKIKAILGSAVIAGFYGINPIHPSLGYNSEI